jgi:hypothetical protein
MQAGCSTSAVRHPGTLTFAPVQNAEGFVYRPATYCRCRRRAFHLKAFFLKSKHSGHPRKAGIVVRKHDQLDKMIASHGGEEDEAENAFDAMGENGPDPPAGEDGGTGESDGDGHDHVAGAAGGGDTLT